MPTFNEFKRKGKNFAFPIETASFGKSFKLTLGKKCDKFKIQNKINSYQ
tara:strand:- start:358 stop:504 length:147 start_codon:yes stop_codon:yes gene_type:complete